MRHQAVLFVVQLSLLGSLLSGCGDAGDGGAPLDSAPSTPTDAASTDGVPSDDASPTCDRLCRLDRRADRQALTVERCRELLARVNLTYRITATPSADGSEIGLHMTLQNRSGATLAGSTGGVLKVSPGPKTNQINWGGSSADEFYQKPGTTSSREVWHSRRPPGWHPVGDRVSSFSFYTYSYAPGPGTVVCHLPATVVAPRGLVDGHSSGHWTQESDH